MKEIVKQLASHDLLQDVLEGIPVRIFWKDLNGHYIGSNTLFAKDAGFSSPDELIGKSDHEMGWSDQAESYRTDDLSVIESGIPRIGFEEPQTTPDGKTVWLRTSKVPLRDEEKNIIGILGIYEDITTEKLNEIDLINSEKQYRNIFDNLQDTYYRTDLEGRITMGSPSVARLIGCELDELLGKPIADFYVDEKGREKFLHALSKANGTVKNYEAQVRRIDGDIIWVSTNSHFIFDHDGHVKGVEGSIREITQQKHREQQLRLTQAASDHAPDSIFWIDEQARIRYVNESTCRELGYSREELLNMSVPDLNPALSPDEWIDHWQKLKRRGSFSFETSHRCKDGSLIPIEVSVNLARFEDVEYNIAFSRNISERKQIEAQLRSSEERFQLAMAGANDGLWDWNLETDEVYYSPRWLEMLGYHTDDFPATLDTWSRLVHPDDREQVLQLVTDYLEGRSSSFEVEMRMIHKDGHHVIVLSRASFSETESDCKPKRLVGTHVDITERKHTESALRHSEVKFRDIIDSSPVPYALNDDGLNITYLNQAFSNTFGYDIHDIPTLDAWWPKAYPDEEYRQWVIDTWQSRLEKSRQDGTPFEAIELQIHCKDGSTKTAITGAGTLDADSNGGTHLVTLFDISERKQSEALLEASQKRFSTLFESSNDSLFIHNMKAEFIDVNQTSCERLGYSKQELLNMKISDLDTPEFTARIPERVQLMEEHGKALFESAHIRKDGSIMPVEVSARVINLDGETVAFSTVRDISERKMLEEQLRQAQKMEAIGTLVGGIAHDFNNMLAAIQGNVFLAKEQMQEHPVATDKLANIERLGFRAAEMVQQLLTFARKDSVAMRVFSLNAFMNEGYRLAKAAIPENIDQQTSVCQEELRIKGDATQLQQVIMNLLSNATDAVADVSHPEIHCSLAPFSADAKFMKNHPDLNGNQFACITIADNGHGIPIERLDKIFEPFFTTKEVGKGTGLGLAMLYGAIQNHGGVVDVTSRVNKGTEFRVYLPLCTETTVPLKDKQPANASRHSETILLVDDEASVRQTTAEVLTSMGYQVFEASDGKKALELIKAEQDQFDLIISDIIMPRMGGALLFQSVRKFDKELPIILVTGYDKDNVLDTEILDQHSLVLKKPFDFHLLSRSIQEMIALRKA